MKKALCPACLGTGQVPDHKCIGASLRKLRSRTLREVAAAMGVSYCHVSLLERGKRHWNLDLVERYRKACE